MGEQGGFVRFVPSYGGSLQVLGSPDRRHLIGEHIRRPARSGGLCPPVGVLVTSGLCSSHREHICRIRNTCVTSGMHLLSRSFWRFVPSCGGSRHIGNAFVVSFVILVVPEVRALQWGFSSSSGRSKLSSLGNVFVASFVIPLVP